MKKFREQLIEYKELRGVTFQEIEDHTGVSRPHYSLIVKGVRKYPSIITISRLCKFLKIDRKVSGFYPDHEDLDPVKDAEM